MVASREWHAEYNLRRYYDKKKKYTDMLGGACVLCGSGDNLQFDHKKPHLKKFNIAPRITYPEKAILSEVLKCQLLCFPCHIEKTRGHKDNIRKKIKK